MRAAADRVALASALALAGACAAFALDPAIRLTQYVHDTWGLDQGLPQSSVMALAQAADSTLWVGTQEGLVRFDGQRFDPFEAIADAPLPGAHVLALLAARDGSLWIGTDGGLVEWRDGHAAPRGDPRQLPARVIYALAEGADGAIWIGTHRGLARFAGGRLETVVPAGEALGTIYALHVDRAGTLWVGTSAAGLRALAADGAGGWRTELVGPAVGAVYGLAERPDRTLFAAILGRGLLEVAPDRTTRLWTEKDGLPTDALTGVGLDRDGSVWFGTQQGSVGRWRDGRVEALAGERSLGEDAVGPILEDREGGLWIGTDGGGLHRLRVGALVPWGAPEGLADDIALSVFADPDGTVWSGSENGGLSRWRAGAFENLAGRAGVPGEAVLSFARTRDGTLWFGTKGKGLCRFAERATRCESVGDGIAASISAILEDRRGRLWVGTPGGLHVREGGRFVAVSPETPLTGGFVLALHEDRGGTIWAGVYAGGLWSLAPNGDGRFHAVEISLDMSPTAFLEDPDGTLWVATSGQGLLRSRAGVWTRFTRRGGLPDDTLYSLLDDGDGHLWTSTNHGVVRLDRRELESAAPAALRPRLFDRDDGARSGECNGGTQPAGARAPDGRLWFPTLRGLVAIDPRAAGGGAALPAARLAEVRLDGRPIPVAGSLRIPPGADRLELRFTVPTLRPAAKIALRHQLEGYDPDWNRTPADRMAVYRRLPPGTYRLLVLASDENGRESAAPLAVELAVEPRWTETALFRVGVAAFVLAAAFALYRLRVRGLEARERRLAALVDERTRELASVNDRLRAANVELTRLSATDPLTGLANRRRFDERLDQEWRRAAREGQELALLVVDVDAFKAFNDAYGHPAGDEILRRVAGEVGALAQRAGDLAARLGGEEFALLLPAIGEANGLELAERLRRAVDELAIPHATSPVASRRLTVSVGVAAARPSARLGPDSLVARADRALYRAKQGGRDRVVGAGS